MDGACSTYRERRDVYRVLVGKPDGKRPLEEPVVDEKIILIWIFRKWNVGQGLDRAGSGLVQVADTCECGNVPSGSIKCGEFLD